MDDATRLLSADEAKTIILNTVAPVVEWEEIPLDEALGRVLAENIYAEKDIPSHDTAAMDGYAIRSEDASAERTVFRIVGKALAGHPVDKKLKRGEAVRIMTGAMLPPKADCFVMQENAQLQDNDHVVLPAGQIVGQNIRRKGEELEAGELALSAGLWLRPSHIGQLAAFGRIHIKVRRRLRVVIFTSGDELIEPAGITPPPGKIYESARATLRSTLRRIGCEVVDYGIVADNPIAIALTLAQACNAADAVLSCGGVSVGEADFIREQLARIGEIAFWRIAIKPGKPFAFGKAGKAQVFGLPGNPVATLVSYHQFVLPALLKMMGIHPQPEPPTFKCKCSKMISKRAGRREFVRGVVHVQDGMTVVTPTERQGAASLLSMVQANCFIILDEEAETIQAGETVSVQPFEGFL